ncbi:hypothetical protein M8C21_020102 [Ambrosia artemisiifolia]|uniref:Calcium-transporting P-type ATPase N-terminal autoinhibitory domain-containing protein n=1 Tax=Ambrosia artemisiifolia TaxID=4212 RepID=A0AAD5CJT0_AMBAR|nr:hypothetical protein M8C21_020102 [Ambrosia artemisiifolia]
MEDHLNEKPKHLLKDQVLQKWRDMCGLVNNPKRRFRFTANIHEPAAMHPTTPPINQKLRVSVLVSKVAFHLLNGELLNN